VSRLLATLVAIAAVACAPVAQPSGSASPISSLAVALRFDGAKAKAHVDWLADPARGGRYSGSAGFRDAANYVADRFKEIGLEPLGDNGTYFQHLTMPNVELTEMPVLSRLGADKKDYRPRVDFTESVNGRAGSGTAEAEIALVGGGAQAGGQDDFAGADVQGRIALVTGPAQQGSSAVENAYQAGAVGVLVVGNTDIRYSYIPRFAAATIPTLIITEAVANELLAPSGKTVAGEQAAVQARRTDPRAPAVGFDVATTVRVSVSLTPVHDIDAMNVVGLLRAPDENGAKRAVLVGGHLDGVGTDPNGAVFQAANDNASGPAIVIESARALAAMRASLAHSIVFVAFAGEEEGLFGSDAYAAQMASSPGRVESLIGMLDLDVIGCCGDTLIVSNESPDLQGRVRNVATGFGIPSQSVTGGGSDETSFVRRRVPSVFIGWSDYILHTYRDVPNVVETSRLQKGGDVVTEVARELASSD
jgi:peptidase M28-like protein/PA domain-containing protein